MSKIMKPQIYDPQKPTSAGKCGADGIGRVRKDFRFRAGHQFDDRQRLRWQLAIDVIALLVAGMLHVTNEDSILIQVVPL